MEESERLSEEGREYVGRLNSVARKAAAMARFLKEMGRMSSHPFSAEAMEPSLLVPDLRAHLEQTFPDTIFRIDTNLRSSRTRTDVRLLRLALGDLLGLLVGDNPGPECSIRLTATDAVEGVELRAGVPSPRTAHSNAGTKPAPDPPMELVLIHEWLTAAGGKLVALGETDGVREFTVIVPRADSHA
jgi:hypothetical protein